MTGDRQRFLETLGEACEKTGFGIHAYVLMGNHYHLLVETPEGNLVAGMKVMDCGSVWRCRGGG
jgi:REP element-mobilizing transposase RayT